MWKPSRGLGMVFTNPYWTEAAVPGTGGRDGGVGPQGGGPRGGGVCRGQVTARRAASSVELLLEAEAPRGRLGGPGPSWQRGRGHGGLEGRAAQSHLARLHRARPGPQRQGLQVAAQGGLRCRRFPGSGGGGGNGTGPAAVSAGRGGGERGGAAVHTLPSGLGTLRRAGRAPPVPRRLRRVRSQGRRGTRGASL